MGPGGGLPQTGLLHAAADAEKAFGHGQRIKEVIFQPPPQRDVPPAPVVVNTGGEVRAAEVIHQINPQNLCHPARNINTAGEIRIQLQGIEQQNKQQGCSTEFLVIRGNGLNRNNRPVGDDHFFEKSPQDQFQTVLHPGKGEIVGFNQLMRKLAVQADGTLNNLGKEGDKQRELCRIALGWHLFPVDINHISHGLEGVKGNAQRQQQVQDGQPTALAE